MTKLGKLQSAAALLCAAAAGGCDRRPAAAPRPAGPTIRLATTTSVDNSGLLDYLLPKFTQATGISVHVLSMGTGMALKTARRGDCDVVLVHAREQEDVFVAEGFGVDRRDLMYNRFMIVGPPGDPAGVAGTDGAAGALRRIAERQAAFCSRGDESGTHVKEMALWRMAKVEPRGAWYLQVGQGMAGTLTIADQKDAYTLTDEGTFLALEPKLRLRPLATGGAELRNPYGIMAVNPRRYPHVKHEAAMKLIEFLCSPPGQELIGGYRLGGRQLFHPWPTATTAATGG